MSSLSSLGAAMVLTAASLTAFGWLSDCQTCLSVGDAGLGSFFTLGGLALLLAGGPLERFAKRRVNARFDLDAP